MSQSGANTANEQESHRPTSVAVDPLHAEWTVEQWAWETLGIERTASLDERRRRVLECIESADLTPPRSCREAVAVLFNNHTATSLGKTPSYRAEREVRLWEQIERFAHSFFEIIPSRRREAWQKLRYESASFPPLRVRLDRLAPGLAISAGMFSHPVGDQQQLAQWLRHLFQNHPTQIGRYLRTFEQQIAESPLRWSRAAVGLYESFPEIAHIKPLLAHEVRQQATRTAFLTGLLDAMSDHHEAPRAAETYRRSTSRSDNLLGCLFITVIVLWTIVYCLNSFLRSYGFVQ